MGLRLSVGGFHAYGFACRVLASEDLGCMVSGLSQQKHGFHGNYTLGCPP